MDLRSYLDFSISHKCYMKRHWMVTAFSVTKNRESDEKYIGMIVKEPYGTFYLDEHLQPQKLDVKEQDKAFFTVTTPIKVTPSNYGFKTTTELDSTVGRLILNLIAVLYPYEGRIDYINSQFNFNTFKYELQDDLDDPSKEDTSKIYVRNYMKASRAAIYLDGLCSLFVHSVTSAGIVAPPGTKEFVKSLHEKYKGQLSDPVAMGQYNAELKKFDQDYLSKNDPSYGLFMSGKPLNARRPQYLSQGGEQNPFSGSSKVVPILQSLQDGISFEADKFTATSNTIRYGSYSRGAETVNGGVAAKTISTAFDTWKIEDVDCKSTIGLKKIYRERNIKQLVERYIIENGKSIKIETLDQAKNYIGKEVSLRSPQYCKLEGMKTCKVCAGERLAMFDRGMVIAGLELTSGIMDDSLKKMHDTEVKSRQVVFAEMIN